MYRTVNGKNESEIKRKKSKFIANIKNVKTDNEAEEFIEQIKKRYNDARHNVFAYRIESGKEKYTDDGEPHGSAGLPILEALKHENLTNIVVVVTRYFGGTLLGVGGLVRAYTDSFKETLNDMEIIEKKLYKKIKIKVSYHLSGKIENEILKFNATIKNINYKKEVTLTIYVLDKKKDELINKIINLTSNNVEIDEKEKINGYIKDDKFVIE